MTADALAANVDRRDAARNDAAAYGRRARRADRPRRPRRRTHEPARAAVAAPGARRRADVPELGQALEITAAALRTLSPPPDEDDPTLGPRVTPLELRAFLARLRLLDGVPFSYLVADASCCRTESIRFFYLDRAWTDALVQGALSVGTVSTADRAQLESLYPPCATRSTRRSGWSGSPAARPSSRAGGPVSGFLLRSRAVSGWPGLHVRAYREPSSARPTTPRSRSPTPADQGAAHGAPGARGAAGALRRRPGRAIR